MITPPSGPARPGSRLRSEPPAPAATEPSVVPVREPDAVGGADPLAGLPGLQVAQHADVLAAEHDRLHRLLATIDQL